MPPVYTLKETDVPELGIVKTISIKDAPIERLGDEAPAEPKKGRKKHQEVARVTISGTGKTYSKLSLDRELARYIHKEPNLLKKYLNEQRMRIIETPFTIMVTTVGGKIIRRLPVNR